MSRRAEVDRGLCASVSMCITLAPGAFALDADGISTFRPTGDVDDADLEEARDGCPMSAIRLLP